MFLKCVQNSGGGTEFQYSLTEQKTNLKWIDGKDIYCKTVNTGALTTEYPEVNHNITNIDNIIGIDGFAIRDTYFFPLPYVHTSTSSLIGVFVDKTKISLRVGSDQRTISNSYITIYYTKTS